MLCFSRQKFIYPVKHPSVWCAKKTINCITKLHSCVVLHMNSIFTSRVHSTREGNVLTRVCLSVHMGWQGGPTLDEGEGVHTLNGGYLPWVGEGVPIMDRRRRYLPWIGRWYLLWMGGGGVPTFDGGREYLPWMAGGGTYLGPVMPWAVHLLRLSAGGLSCLLGFYCLCT